MTYDIASNKCEICNKQAKVATNDKDMVLHYSCDIHITELWDKIGKP